MQTEHICKLQTYQITYFYNASELSSASQGIELKNQEEWQQPSGIIYLHEHITNQILASETKS